MHRFYSETPITVKGQYITLDREESLHAARVLRLQIDDEVQVLDGNGIWEGKLTGVSEAGTEVEIKNALPSPEAPCQAILWQGLPKADKMEWIVQKGTELGAASFWPVEMERSVVRPDKSSRDEKKRDRLRKIVLEAVKQSGRACIPYVEKTMTFSEAIQKAGQGMDLILVAWEEEHSLSLSEAVFQEKEKKGMPKKVLIVIGPEGGISLKEYEQLRAIGAKAVTLGKRILRTETAGLCALSVLWTALGEM